MFASLRYCSTSFFIFLFHQKTNVMCLTSKFSLFIIAPLFMITSFLHCDSNYIELRFARLFILTLHTHSSYCKYCSMPRWKSQFSFYVSTRDHLLNVFIRQMRVKERQCGNVMYQSNRNLNIPPRATPGHLNF